MFFKIGALKDFPIFKLKKETLTEVLFCEFANFLITAFFTEHLRWLLLHFLKVITQLFCKGV